MADYCVYWIRRSHDHLPMCTPENPLGGRAGLVGTQNIRNNKSREGGLDHVVGSGTIVEAVDNQPWSGEANVHVSIVNWVKRPSSASGTGGGSTAPIEPAADPWDRGDAPPAPGADGGRDASLLIPAKRRLWVKVPTSLPLYDPEPEKRGRRVTTTAGKRGRNRADKSYELERRECDHINAALSDQTDVTSARVLECNANPQRCFQGVVTGYNGFVVTLTQRRAWIADDTKNAEVVRPYQIGRDVLGGDGSPKRAAIDFADRNVIDAQQYSGPFQHLQAKVLPAVSMTASRASETDMAKARAQHLDRWWQFWNVREGMRAAIRPFSRVIVCARVTKRPIFCFIDNRILADGALQVFAFDDDYSFGILSANPHWQWFVAKCSKLTERFRYTPDSVFDTFPWPQSPGVAQVDAVAEAGREVRRVRGDALAKIKGGLRAVYRTLELPGKNPLKDAHAALDAAVMAAYGFNPKRDLLAQLLALNLDVAAKIDRNEPVTAPGVPTTYGDASTLVTADCIRPL